MMDAKLDSLDDALPAWSCAPCEEHEPVRPAKFTASNDAGFGQPANSTPPHADLLVRLLDELDYGLMLVTGDARVCLANRQATRQCAGQDTLLLHAGVVRPCLERDQSAFTRALVAAGSGRRSMLSVGPPDAQLSLAVIPVRDHAGSGTATAATLLVFGKRNPCEPLSVEFFSREHRLTGAEGGVLRELCKGQSPLDIARRAGVAISTVRTQIASIRLKTGARTIGELVRRVTMLPPIVPVLA